MATCKNRFLTILILAFVFVSAGAKAQKNYFVYFQSDNQQPFYINIGGKNVSSSAIGYAIIPKLVDSTYPLKIGFTSGLPVQEFDLVVNGNDQGFIIKDFGEKGFGLFNLQSLTVQMNINGASKRKEELAVQQAQEEKRVKDSLAAATLLVEEKKKADSVKLASEQEANKKATDSTAISQTIPAAAATAAVVAGATVAGATGNSTGDTSGDTAGSVSKAAPAVAVAATVEAGKNVAADSVKKETVITDSVVLKDSSNLTMYEDSGTITKPDTTGATRKTGEIQKEGGIESPVNGNATLPAGAVATGTAVTVATGINKTSEGFLDMELGADSLEAEPKPKAKDSAATVIAVKDSTRKDTLKADTTAVKSKPDTSLKGTQAIPNTSSATGSITMNTPNTVVVAPAAGVAVASGNIAMITNSACKKIASEKDFYAVRKKMVSNDDPGQMILTAKEAFREKCYTNDQLRNLCVLFLDDASRYRFLDEAYPYSSDPPSYKQLGDLLKDDYYSKRFNAMLK